MPYEFSVGFVRASNNETLIEIVENLRKKDIWFRFSYFYFSEAYEFAIRVHRETLDAFIRKDGNRAETLVRKHILKGLERLIKRGLLL